MSLDSSHARLWGHFLWWHFRLKCLLKTKNHSSFSLSLSVSGLLFVTNYLLLPLPPLFFSITSLSLHCRVAMFTSYTVCGLSWNAQFWLAEEDHVGWFTSHPIAQHFLIRCTVTVKTTKAASVANWSAEGSCLYGTASGSNGSRVQTFERGFMAHWFHPNEWNRILFTVNISHD